MEHAALPDLPWFWHNDARRRIVSSLATAMLESGGLQVLTGGAGGGKTTLARAVVATVEDRARVAWIRDPGLTRAEMFEALAREFGFDAADGSLNAVITAIQEQRRTRRAMLVVVDEAQRLSPETLEALVQLASLAPDAERAPFSVLLVGDERFDARLAMHPRLARCAAVLRERLGAMSPDDVERFQEWRRTRPPAPRSDVFDRLAAAKPTRVRARAQVWKRAVSLAALVAIGVGISTIAVGTTRWIWSTPRTGAAVAPPPPATAAAVSVPKAETPPEPTVSLQPAATLAPVSVPERVATPAPAAKAEPVVPLASAAKPERVVTGERAVKPEGLAKRRPVQPAAAVKPVESERVRAPRSDEPDPGAVIDWVLSRRSER